ncbi:MAG: Hsp33 family molecular chaperone HslO [Proteobacteria bacterium]|nr:Hsp33 family molecular chaperone HslO [Pseudomonadota bacterium]
MAADAGRPAADALTRFVVDAAGVRGSALTLDATTATLLAARDYPPAIAAIVRELAVAAALLASALKFDGRLVLQAASQGPLKLVVVECDRGLALRATAQWDAEGVAALPTDASMKALAGGDPAARFIVALDRPGTQPYQGVVALPDGPVAAAIAHYLTTSEQVASRLAVASRGTRAAGWLLQRMPPPASSLPDDDTAREAAWQRIAAGDDEAAVTALLEGDDVESVLRTRFAWDDVRMLATAHPHAGCRCSEERVVRALRIAGRDEIEAAIAERGEVEVTCEFCNRRYVFAADVARALVGDAPTTPQ